MVEKKYKIFWTQKAKLDTKAIFDFYKPKSIKAAKKIKDEILQKPRSIIFPEQYRVDEVEPMYRRVIVRHFKILYSFKDQSIYIHRVFDVRKDPGKQTED